jgi:hypothetical protein
MEASTSPQTSNTAIPPATAGKSRPITADEDTAAGAVSAQHCIMFWVLTVVAMIVFAPCVLMPIWAETEQIIQGQRKMEQLVTDLKAQADHNDTRIRALLADPKVNERIVRRELNYRPEGEQVIQWTAAELAAIRSSLPDSTPTAGESAPINPYPAWATVLIKWLPAWPWRKMFVETPNRYLLLSMSAGLLATAFFLYGPVPVVARRRKPA